MERAFDVAVYQLVPSASLAPSLLLLQTFARRLATKRVSSQNSQKTNY
jgi:hypothetical protein